MGDEGARGCAEIREQVRKIGMGCCVLKMEPDDIGEGGAGFTERMVLPLWRRSNAT